MEQDLTTVIALGKYTTVYQSEGGAILATAKWSRQGGDLI